ncbi:MAG TPA: glycosyltransferase, partial [Planctomycetota bacterium]|nr:glycosyltransferase [Planctomycetota bacterium]
TVSPTYSREIRTPEHGHGLDPVLRGRGGAVSGILNGVDYDEWDPAKDPHLPARYSTEDLAGKAACKAELQKRCGLPVRADVPVVGIVSRLAEQKGIDLLLGGLDALLSEDAQYVILGSGDSRFEDALRHAAGRRRDRLSVHLKFDNGLAHLIEAGSDLFLMPSKYEPCGLNQIYSLRYGTLPIVRSTGGLADTVVEGATGFVFGPYTVEAMVETVRRAVRTWRDPETRHRMITAGMRQDFSWTASARQYAALYDRVLKEAPAVTHKPVPPSVPVD